MAWATFEDVISRWVGSGAPTDEDLVEALIGDAEAVILAAYPRIQERIDAGTLPIATVTFVVTRMVSRLLRNPEGLQYWQQTTGPFSVGKNYGSGSTGSATDIWLSADEKAMLAPAGMGKAFSVDVAPDAVSPTDTSEVWLDVE